MSGRRSRIQVKPNFGARGNKGNAPTSSAVTKDTKAGGDAQKANQHEENCTVLSDAPSASGEGANQSVPTVTSPRTRRVSMRLAEEEPAGVTTITTPASQRTRQPSGHQKQETHSATASGKEESPRKRPRRTSLRGSEVVDDAERLDTANEMPKRVRRVSQRLSEADQNADNKNIGSTTPTKDTKLIRVGLETPKMARPVFPERDSAVVSKAVDDSTKTNANQGTSRRSRFKPAVQIKSRGAASASKNVQAVEKETDILPEKKAATADSINSSASDTANTTETKVNTFSVETPISDVNSCFDSENQTRNEEANVPAQPLIIIRPVAKLVPSPEPVLDASSFFKYGETDKLNESVKKDTQAKPTPVVNNTVKASQSTVAESSEKIAGVAVTGGRRARGLKVRPNVAEAARRHGRLTSISEQDDYSTPKKSNAVKEDASHARERKDSTSMHLNSSHTAFTEVMPATSLPVPAPSLLSPATPARPHTRHTSESVSVTPVSKVEKVQKKRSTLRLLAEPVSEQRSKLTLRDIIHCNPLCNPMKGSEKDAKKNAEGKAKDKDNNKNDQSSQKKDPPAKDAEKNHKVPTTTTGSGAEDNDVVEIDGLNGKENDGEKDVDEEMPVAQVMIGADGQIILNEKSLVLTNPADSQESFEDTEVVIEKDTYKPECYYKKKKRSKLWTNKETSKFYVALSTIGTDFFLMSNMFSNRSREDLKRKFKKEEKIHKDLIDQAMRDRRPLDMSVFEPSSENEDDKKEEQENKKKQKKAARQRKKTPKEPKAAPKRKEKSNGKVKKRKGSQWYDDSSEESDANVPLTDGPDGGIQQNGLEKEQGVSECTSDLDIVKALLKPKTQSGRQPKRAKKFESESECGTPESKTKSTVPKLLPADSPMPQTGGIMLSPGTAMLTPGRPPGQFIPLGNIDQCKDNAQLLFVTSTPPQDHQKKDGQGTKLIHVYLVSPPGQPGIGSLTPGEASSLASPIMMKSAGANPLVLPGATRTMIQGPHQHPMGLMSPPLTRLLSPPLRSSASLPSPMEASTSQPSENFTSPPRICCLSPPQMFSPLMNSTQCSQPENDSSSAFVSNVTADSPDSVTLSKNSLGHSRNKGKGLVKKPNIRTCRSKRVSTSSDTVKSPTAASAQELFESMALEQSSPLDDTKSQVLLESSPRSVYNTVKSLLIDESSVLESNQDDARINVEFETNVAKVENPAAVFENAEFKTVQRDDGTFEILIDPKFSDSDAHADDDDYDIIDIELYPDESESGDVILNTTDDSRSTNFIVNSPVSQSHT